jgi:hypothetical protein
MNRLFFLILFLCAALFVQACAKPYSGVLRQYREASPCCASLAELPVEPLQLGDTKSFDLADNSPAFRFETGKSYFRAFTLPQGPYPYRVTVRSYLVGGYLKSAYLFYPQLLTLDANRKVVRATGPGTFSLEQAGLLEAMQEAEGLRYLLAGGVTFTEGSHDERYLIILTTDELLQGRTSVPTGGELFLPGYDGPVTAKREVLVPHAPSGRVTVALAPLASGSPVETEVAQAGGEAVTTPPAGRAEHVTVRLASGKAIGELELGRSTLDTARRLFENAGVGLGPEKEQVATFAVGKAPLAVKRLYSPPGTLYQLYFDDHGILVLLVDGAPVDFPHNGKAFILRFPAARETGRTLGSYELQVSLSTCVTLITVFNTVNDTLASTGYGYGCPVR